MGNSEDTSEKSKHVLSRVDLEQKEDRARRMSGVRPAFEKAVDEVMAEHDELLGWLTLSQRATK